MAQLLGGAATEHALNFRDYGKCDFFGGFCAEVEAGGGEEAVVHGDAVVEDVEEDVVAAAAGADEAEVGEFGWEEIAQGCAIPAKIVRGDDDGGAVVEELGGDRGCIELQDVPAEEGGLGAEGEGVGGVADED